MDLLDATTGSRQLNFVQHMAILPPIIFFKWNIHPQPKPKSHGTSYHGLQRPRGLVSVDHCQSMDATLYDRWTQVVFVFVFVFVLGFDRFSKPIHSERRLEST